jgi:hypothetical protein
MSAASWSIPAVPRAVPPARAGPSGDAPFLLAAARPRAGRCRAAPRRLRLGRPGGLVVVARAGAAEAPVADSGEAAVVFSEKFPLRRSQTVTCPCPVLSIDYARLWPSFSGLWLVTI